MNRFCFHNLLLLFLKSRVCLDFRTQRSIDFRFEPLLLSQIP